MVPRNWCDERRRYAVNARNCWNDYGRRRMLCSKGALRVGKRVWCGAPADLVVASSAEIHGGIVATPTGVHGRDRVLLAFGGDIEVWCVVAASPKIQR